MSKDINNPPIIDHRMQLGYGSAWHMLRCLGFQRDLFSQIVGDAIGGRDVEWEDFTRYQGKKTYPKGHPILDDEWKRVSFLPEDEPIRAKFDGEFWPLRSDQCWDAIGHATVAGKREWLLVEAKAHVGEILKRGKPPERGIKTIADAFEKTRTALECEVDPMKWLTGYYQYANRLAALYFLNLYDDKNPIPARLIFVYFCGDTYQGKNCPQKPADWRPILTEVKSELGLGAVTPLASRVHEVFLPVALAGFSLNSYKQWVDGDLE